MLTFEKNVSIFFLQITDCVTQPTIIKSKKKKKKEKRASKLHSAL